MKKYLIILSITLALILTGCAAEDAITKNTDGNTTTTEGSTTTTVTFDKNQSLVFSTYLAGGLLSSDTFANNMTNTLNDYNISLLTTVDGNEGFQIETELDEVNVYFNKLKVLMDGNMETLLDVNEQVSTRAGYDSEVTYTLDGITYTIYFNQTIEEEIEDETTTENEVDEEVDEEKDDEDDKDEDEKEDEKEFRLEGLIVIDGIEYQLVGAREMEESESKMYFETVDSNNGNKLKVEMKEEDGEQKFEIKSTINGVTKSSKIKFEKEENETKVKLKLVNGEEESEYEFKKETEDGETVYKFKYKIGEVEGEVKIFEVVDETTGAISYRYDIEEDGKKKEIEKDKDKDHDDDDDDDDDESEDNDSEETV